jgi:hypothetical protein
MTRARDALTCPRDIVEARTHFEQLTALRCLRVRCEVDGKAWEENLYAGSFVLGRHSALRFHFDNSDVSQFHARIELDTAKHQWAAKDLNSSNGSFLNGKRLRSDRRTFLKKGDRLELVDVASLQVLDVRSTARESPDIFSTLCILWRTFGLGFWVSGLLCV